MGRQERYRVAGGHDLFGRDARSPEHRGIGSDGRLVSQPCLYLGQGLREREVIITVEDV